MKETRRTTRRKATLAAVTILGAIVYLSWRPGIHAQDASHDQQRAVHVLTFDRAKVLREWKEQKC